MTIGTIRPHPTSEVSHGWNCVQWGFAVFKISQFIDMSVSEANSFYSLATDSSSCNALQWVMLCLGLSLKAAVNKVNEKKTRQRHRTIPPKNTDNTLGFVSS